MVEIIGIIEIIVIIAFIEISVIIEFIIIIFIIAEVSETLGFETETETWVVSVSVSRLEISPLKAESQSKCLRLQTERLGISLTV